MNSLFYPWLACFLSAIIVILSTPVIRKIGFRTGYFDKPDPRKIHQKPMVRLGGIAICLGTLIASIAIWFLGRYEFIPDSKSLEFWGVVIGGFLFFLIGLADDLFKLSPFTRLFLQFGIASLVWLVGVRIEFITLPGLGLTQIGWLSLPVTVIWLTGVVNAINWMDGLDGLAAGISGIAAGVMLVVCLFMDQPAAALIAAALTGAMIGFLRYNFNPAQIFMGDGGSYFIGFIIAGVGIIGLVKTAALTIVSLPLLILAVPIVDMSAVIVARLFDGRSPFYPDQRHLHHRLLKAGLSQRSSVLVIYALTFWVGSLALAVAGIPIGILYVTLASCLLAGLSWYLWQEAR
ncbi:MAG: glycosyltransferase family 4 protein [Microcoleaceae cyanobacterium]